MKNLLNKFKKENKQKNKKPVDNIEWFLNLSEKEHKKFMKKVIHQANQDQLRMLEGTSK